MQIAKGTRLVRQGFGARVAVQVTALRHSPIAYAEIEPVEGGRRRAVLLAELERDFQLVSEALPVESSRGTSAVADPASPTRSRRRLGPSDSRGRAAPSTE